MTDQPNTEEQKDHKYRLEIDKRQRHWPVEHITGLELKELAKVDPKTFTVWEVTPGSGDDIEIHNHQEVDLKGPEKIFITGKKHSTEG